MGYAIMAEQEREMDGRVRFHRFRYHLAAGFVAYPDIVLDLGCGSAYGTEILSKRAFEVHAYDKEQSNIDYAQTNHRGDSIFYTCADLEEVTLEKGTVGVAFEVLEHLYNPKAFVDKLKQAVSKYIIVSVPLNQPLTLVDGDIQEVGDATHHSSFTKQTLMDMFIDDNWREFWSFQDGVTLIAVFYNLHGII